MAEPDVDVEEEHSYPPPQVLTCDMPLDMQKFAFAQARAALTAHRIEKDQATLVKRKLEEEFKGTWHCVVGKSFGASVAHETGFILLFSIGKVHFLVFQSLDEEPAPPEAPPA